MCGIAGIFSFRGPVERDRLDAAATRLTHRGPDDRGVYLDAHARAGFAQCRLAIIDLSPAGHQPMIWRDPSGAEVVLNYNGEIYNYREVRAECEAGALTLRGQPISWVGTSDTEVILWAYVLWGERMLEMLDGMFALSIWDGRARRMLLARDRFGVKPLYYSADHERLVFASEIKALGALAPLDTSLDPVAISQYITFLFTPGQRTMFRSVRKLPPGGLLVAEENGRLRQAMFAPCFPVGSVDPSLTEESAAHQLVYHLEEAVRRQMVADVPVGAFLSGGLDSSSIVNFARKYAKDRQLQCFTIGSPDGHQIDSGWATDLPFARRVAETLGVKLHTVRVGPEMAKQFAWMVAQLDEPQADPAALNAYFISEVARSRGIKVLLSGAGGDDIFSGYRRHDALMLERWWAWLPRLSRKVLRLAAERVAKGSSAGRRFGKAFQHADASSEERLVGYFQWLSSDLTRSLLNPELARNANPQETLAPMFAALRGLPRTNPLQQMLHLDSRFFLVDHNLAYTDKMGMAASVEVRVPFMDPKLVAFAASLPPQFKQRGRTGKWIFKRAMEPYLPKDVIYRPKTGFGVPLRSWLRHELRGQVDEILAESTIRQRGLFDPREVSRLIEADRSGRLDASYPLFALMCIETWCRKFVDGQTAVVP